MRGLRALGIAADSYGSLLSPVILKKLPQELRLIVSREVREGRWNLDELMRLIDVEIKARECASNTSNASTDGNRLLKAQGKSLPTNTALYSSESPVPKCSYCRQQHSSISCRTVTDPNERKQILRKAGRCFVCLRRHHTSRDCRSTLRCTGCGGRHHTSICNGRMMQDGARSQTIRQNKVLVVFQLLFNLRCCKPRTHPTLVEWFPVCQLPLLHFRIVLLRCQCCCRQHKCLSSSPVSQLYQ